MAELRTRCWHTASVFSVANAAAALLLGCGASTVSMEDDQRRSAEAPGADGQPRQDDGRDPSTLEDTPTSDRAGDPGGLPSEPCDTRLLDDFEGASEFDLEWLHSENTRGAPVETLSPVADPLTDGDHVLSLDHSGPYTDHVIHARVPLGPRRFRGVTFRARNLRGTPVRLEVALDYHGAHAVELESLPPVHSEFEVGSADRELRLDQESIPAAAGADLPDAFNLRFILPGAEDLHLVLDDVALVCFVD